MKNTQLLGTVEFIRSNETNTCIIVEIRRETKQT